MVGVDRLCEPEPEPGKFPEQEAPDNVTRRRPTSIRECDNTLVSKGMDLQDRFPPHLFPPKLMPDTKAIHCCSAFEWRLPPCTVL